MQVQNIECQIAKAQIGRYLAGDALSDDAVAQLESHVATCESCKQNLAERRAVLLAMLSPVEASQRSEREETTATTLPGRIRARLPGTAVVQEAKQPHPTSFVKPMLYSLALGAVLIAMSYASRNLGSVLGAKAIPPANAPAAFDGAGAAGEASGQVEAAPTATAAPAVKPQPDPATPVTPAGTDQPKSAKAVTTVSTKPEGRARSRKRSRAPQPPAPDSIKVYAPENE